MQIVKCYLLASTLLFLVGSVPALAVPVTWTLSGVTFNDGGVATGSFVYDVDTNQFSAINLVTTTGSLVSGATFSFDCQSPCTGSAPTSVFDLYLTTPPSNNLTGTAALDLVFTPGLSNAGGTVTLQGTQVTCSSATCSGGISAPIRVTTAGAAVSKSAAAIMPTPTMSFFALLFLGLMLVLCLLPRGGQQPQRRF
jgi:hypothetical protein